MTAYILIALAALAILVFIGWRLFVTDGDWPNAERLVPDGADWSHFVPQIVVRVNPYHGDDLPQA